MSQEVERKFSLADDQQLPHLDGLSEPVDYTLEATYLDSRHFALARARRVVRHRSGGTDAGWHVKLAGPDAEHRVEYHSDGSAPRLPDELRQLVADELDGEALIPVARLRTRRRQAELRDPEGIVLALVCVDDVTAIAGSQEQSWREAEVELVEGTAAVIDEVTERFAAAGIHRSPEQSKIGRALAAVIESDDRTRSSGPTASGVVLDYLSRQVGTLQALEAGVLADAPDAVHRSRVATRRLRSALRTFAPLFRSKAVARLRAELAWHADELGAPRDAEVMLDGMLGALDILEVDPGAAERELIRKSLIAAHTRAHAELVETMGSRRYDELHRLLADWLVAPALSAAADATAAPMLHGLLDQARGRVTRLYAKALRAREEPARWHEVRKAAKAARYCSEALEPVFGNRASDHAAAWEAVTDAFGELQDSVVARATITQLASDSPVLDSLLAYEVGRGRAELARGRAALDAALAASL